MGKVTVVHANSSTIVPQTFPGGNFVKQQTGGGRAEGYDELKAMKTPEGMRGNRPLRRTEEFMQGRQEISPLQIEPFVIRRELSSQIYLLDTSTWNLAMTAF